MNAFLEWLAGMPIPVEDAMRELAWASLVVVFGLGVLFHVSHRWLAVPCILFILWVWLWWKLDQYPRG